MTKNKKHLYSSKNPPILSQNRNSFFKDMLQKIKAMKDRLKRKPSSLPPSKPLKKPSPKGPKFSLRWVLLKLFISLAIWGISLGSLVVLWFSYDLPDVNKLQASVRKPGVVIQAADGTIIGTYGDLYEDMVKINELPAYVPQAFMAIEDRRFYHHFGVDVIGLIRAAYTNYKANRVVQGGSTLTQQLAKNFLFTQGLYDTRDRSIRRKIQEVILSVWLEWKFTKDQILTIYLNRVYFGAGTYGIDAASRMYFNKPARLLTVYESAVIAGLLKAPSKYSPSFHPKRARQRATVVLNQMAEEGYISSAADYLKQQEESSSLADTVDDQGSRFFANWAYESIPSLIGGYNQDLVVITTLDPHMQKQAEAATKKMMEEMGKNLKASEISLVAMTPQGAVKAMIGGLDYKKSQFNRATQALRQPGSAFKPIVYLAALEAGFTPDSMISDGPISIGKWAPKNFRKYISSEEGEISLMQALTKSVNTVTVRLAQQVGAAKIAQVAQRLGISSPMTKDLSISLGSMEVTLLELVATYATFANKGYGVWPYGIVEIRNKSGKILYQRQEEITAAPVISSRHNQQMVSMLTNVVNKGTGGSAKISVPAAGKTGSNADKDAWFVGFTSNLVAGVWVGNDDARIPMKKESTGGRLPAKTWSEFMKLVIAESPPVRPLLSSYEGEDGEYIGLPEESAPAPEESETPIPTEDVEEFESLITQLTGQ